MAIELSTAGIQIKYAAEATAGTRPTTGYTALKGVKSIPEIGGEPNNLDATPLEETGWHRYIPGLNDSGGALGITVNDYDDFRTSWAAMMTAYATAKAAGKGMWFEINIPGMAAASKPSFFFSGVPDDLGFGGAEVDAVFENTAYITVNKIHGWDTASTAGQ